MIPAITDLIVEGDSFLKEAKSMFFLKKEEALASRNSCNAIKKYLDAYQVFLFGKMKPIENYHLLLKTITREDPAFKHFYESIYEVKCFAEESKHEDESFYMFADEINDVLRIVFKIRTYVTVKVGYEKDYLDAFMDNAIMTT